MQLVLKCHIRLPHLAVTHHFSLWFPFWLNTILAPILPGIMIDRKSSTTVCNRFPPTSLQFVRLNRSLSATPSSDNHRTNPLTLRPVILVLLQPLLNPTYTKYVSLQRHWTFFCEPSGRGSVTLLTTVYVATVRKGQRCFCLIYFPVN